MGSGGGAPGTSTADGGRVTVFFRPDQGRRVGSQAPWLPKHPSRTRPPASGRRAGSGPTRSSSASASPSACSPSARASCRSLTEWHDDSPSPARGLRQHPERAEAGVLHASSRSLIVYGARPVLAAGAELGAGRSPTTGDHRRRTSSGASRDFRAGVYMQTLLRDPAAGHHALAHLLRLPRPARGHDRRSRSTTSCPRSAKFLHGARYQAYAAVGDAAGLGARSSASSGRIVRRYVAAARTASASRPSPSTR